MDEKPAKAWVWYFIGMWVLISVALIMLGTGTARAQQPCPPLEAMIEELGQKYQERIVWQGVAPSPRGPVEVMLFQSPKGTWTILQVVGITACPIAGGTDATPLNDRGV